MPKRLRPNCASLKKAEPHLVQAVGIPVRRENPGDGKLAIASLPGELLDTPKIPGSGTPIELVMLVLRVVIEGAVSMRAASRISGSVCEFTPVRPSRSCKRLWALAQSRPSKS